MFENGHCPSCDSKEMSKQITEEYPNDALSDVTHKSVLILCKNCGFSFNCLGSKKI